MQNAGLFSGSAHAPTYLGSVESTATNGPALDELRFESLLFAIVAACVKRLRQWTKPVNWSSSDWEKELQQIAWLAALRAECRFDPKSNIAFEAFVYNHIRSGSRTCYRREKLHEMRFTSQPSEMNPDEDGRDSHFLRFSTASEPDVFDSLRNAIATLTEPQRRVIQAHFWEGYNETEIGRMLGVSQRTVNKHKRLAIELLREALPKVV